MATREYFRGWRLGIPPEWRFIARQRRPPPDPVNAMLSLATPCWCTRRSPRWSWPGWTPRSGFLHQARWRRPSLALDVMEEFRPLIVDAVVLRWVTTGMVQPEEFETTPEQGCRMNTKARHTFLAASKRRMLTLFTHEQTRRRVSYRVGVGLQAKALARSVLDPGEPYRPIRWK